MVFPSFFKSLLLRYGSEFAVVILLALGFHVFKIQAQTTEQKALRTDAGASNSPRLQNLRNIQKIVDQAETASKNFLNWKRPQDLENYNLQVMSLNQQLGILAQQGRSLPETNQATEALVVNQLRRAIHNYFEIANGEMVQKQTGVENRSRLPAQSNETATASKWQIQQTLQALIANETAPRPDFWQLGPYRFRFLQTELIFGLGLALLIFFASRQLQREHMETQGKNNRKLQNRSILLDTILNSMSEALIVTDEKGHFTHYNVAAQKIIGTKVKEVATEIGVGDIGFYDVETGKQQTHNELAFHRALHGHEIDDTEILVKNVTHPEGLYISVSSRSLNDIDGRISGALVVFKDISRRKAIEKEWLLARESAVEASKKKSDFLAAMSHEIRTPMNGVIGMTTLLADTPLNLEQKDYVGTIQRSAQSLLMLINDILDHSKIEAGKIRLDPHPFDLQFLVQDVLEIFKPTVGEKNVALEADWTGLAEWLFVGDQGRLRQILVNLIGNAVKFTGHGSVRLKISAAMMTLTGRARIKFEVQDTGPGMHEEERNSLFQKYFQTREGVKFGGTGLGLSISKQLVDLMDGEIGVESAHGVGSNFWFHLDLPPAQTQDIVVKKEVAFSQLFHGRVLLAEDQIVNQRVASTYLRKLGLNVDIAGNGQIALEKLQQNHYDLIFMDCQMPVLSGYEATRRLRQLETQTGLHLPVIALTAEGTSGEKHICFESGMDDFLTKPLELHLLIDKLSTWLQRPPETLDTAALNKLKDYVVNDQNLTQALIEDLAQAGPQLVSLMQVAFANSDLQSLSEAAHALRSSSATLGATQLSQLCAQLEDLKNISTAKNLIDQAEEQLAKSLRELKNYEAAKKTA